MACRQRSREIEIFNFSFLDVLACTIGLLIFIMVMAFILQAGSPVADASAIVRHRNDQTAALRNAAERDTRISDALESQLDRIVPTGAPDLLARRQTAKAGRDAAQAAYLKAAGDAQAAQSAVDRANTQKQANDQGALDRARREDEQARAQLAGALQDAQQNHVTFLPRKVADDDDADASQVIHIDCRPDKVVILRTDADGGIHEVRTVTLSDLSGSDPGFSQLLTDAAKGASYRVLFWVRPTGISSFEAARHLLPEGTSFGFEPADADWVLGSDKK